MQGLNEVLGPFFVKEKRENSSSHKIKAIFKAKVKNALNYKSVFFMTLFLNIVYIFMFYFFGQNNVTIEIHNIPVSYFQYAFIGLSLQMVVGTALATTEQNILLEIITGTWSSTFFFFNIVEYALGTSLAGIFFSSFSILTAYLIAKIFLKISFWISLNILIYLFILFVLLMLAYISFSILFSSVSIWYKKNIGITKLFYELTKTFTGITFPIILAKGYPVAWIISRMMPLTYGLNGIQGILYLNDFLKTFLINSGILIFFIIIIGLLGIFLVKISIKKVRDDGSVSIY